jgi:hypothetical protein
MPPSHLRAMPAKITAAAVQAREDRGRPHRTAKITGTDHAAVDVLIYRILLSSSAPPDTERRTANETESQSTSLVASPMSPRMRLNL